jgi:hypothetical protein
MEGRPVTDEHQRSSGELITVARRLMRGANASWSSLTGRLEVRNDEAWLDEGRKRYHGSAALETSTAPEISAVGYSFSVIKTPWRARMQLLHSAAPGSPEPHPDLIVYRDQTWWARTGSEVKTNGTDVTRRIGLFGLELMICPQSLADIMDYREARETTRERAAILVSAGASEMVWWHAPELVVLSVSRYELEVDRELGILLANRAYIDNRIAREIVLHNIRVDPSFNDEAEFGIPVYPEEGQE